MKALFASFIALILFSSCKKERIGPVSRDYTVSNFNKLHLTGDFELVATKGTVFSIKAIGRSKDVNDLRVIVEAGKLRILYNTVASDRQRVIVKITMPSLVEFQLNEKCLASIRGFDETAEVTGSISGSTKANVTMNVPIFKLNVIGNADLTLSGNAESVEATVSDSGIFNSYAVPAKFGRAIAADLATIRIFSSVVLNASANARSRIYFKGNPGDKFLAELDNARIIEEYIFPLM
jgi:hypothetical protein